MNNLLEKVKGRIIAFSSHFSEKEQILQESSEKIFNPGKLSKIQVRILVLVVLIMFVGYYVFFKQYCIANFSEQESPIVQKSEEEIRKENFKKELSAMVKGHPIEAMVPYIAEKDRETAAYMIGIAKKESNWGERKPVLDGEDCYNYWGFRLKAERMGSGGHTCFDNPKDAVNAISKRIDQIIERNDVESASDMIVWKCGSNCAVTGGQDAANKWIRDVDIYVKKILN